MKNCSPFSEDEILGRGRDWIAVQNSVFSAHEAYRLSEHSCDGRDYVLTDVKGGVGAYIGGMQTIDQFMREEKVYRIVSENYLDGLGKKLQQVTSKRTIKKILDEIAEEVSQDLKKIRPLTL